MVGQTKIDYSALEIRQDASNHIDSILEQISSLGWTLSRDQLARMTAHPAVLCGYIIEPNSGDMLVSGSATMQGEIAYIALIVTNNKYQKTGLGTKLLQWLIQNCKQRSQIVKIVLSATEVATSLYLRNGFIETGEKARLFEISRKGHLFAASFDDVSSEGILWSFKRLEDLSSQRPDLWKQIQMMSDQESRPRTDLIGHHLASIPVYLLMDDKDNVLAWLCVIHGRASRAILRPLIALDEEKALTLIRAVVATEEQIETFNFLYVTKMDPNGRLEILLTQSGWKRISDESYMEYQLKDSISDADEPPGKPYGSIGYGIA